MSDWVLKFVVGRATSISKGLLAITLALVALAVLPTVFPKHLGFLPGITIDTDPENMLPLDDPIRVFHNQAKERFQLHDAVVLGVVNEQHEAGVFNPETLDRVRVLTDFARGLEGVVERDVLSPTTVDSIENEGPGAVRFQWLMEKTPESQKDAQAVRDRALRIPFLKDTLVSKDGRALVLYLPIEEKTYAHDVASALERKIAELGATTDQFHIAGLPVAEDTFGIEMFIQMAISAPLAMLVIFVLMWLFFRSLVIVTAPLLLAMASALITMALLILSGKTIHIMSSMIPIFIMPIAVLDAVHIISDFYDVYPRLQDRRKAVEEVMAHLFQPMFFTSLTTAAGFASLALTPIPPVQVFGIFVAVGVMVAWLATILFIPAYLLTRSDETVQNFGYAPARTRTEKGVLAALGRMNAPKSKVVIAFAVCLMGLTVVGIQRIRVNDNPTNWFEPEHRIRVADRVLNEHFGGTYDAYLELEVESKEYSAADVHQALVAAGESQRLAIVSAFSSFEKEAGQHLDGIKLGQVEQRVRSRARESASYEERAAWGLLADFLIEQADELDEESEEASAEGQARVGEGAPSKFVDALAEYLKERLAPYEALGAISAIVRDKEPASRKEYFALLSGAVEEAGESGLGLFVDRQRIAFEFFKSPEILRYVEALQREMGEHPAVGKSNSLADIVKTVHRDLISGEEAEYRIPDQPEGVAQTLTQYQSSHRKDDLWHFVTPDYQKTLVWFQLKTGDNRDMQSVSTALSNYVASHPPPVALAEPRWFGLTYINVVWQEKMVEGMMNALLGSFVVVLLMMTLLFRSVLWGILSMIPLSLTVALIYGVLGLVGKDYDMPVAVLSSLSLGLAVDYAIHFLARSRELRERNSSWAETQVEVFQEPARAIWRNVVIVGFGFLPLLFAPLVPYQTVGLLIATILLVAGVTTLVLLPALIQLLQRQLFKSPQSSEGPSDDPPHVRTSASLPPLRADLGRSEFGGGSAAGD